MAIMMIQLVSNIFIHWNFTLSNLTISDVSCHLLGKVNAHCSQQLTGPGKYGS
jgi:hypothetical protein